MKVSFIIIFPGKEQLGNTKELSVAHGQVKGYVEQFRNLEIQMQKADEDVFFICLKESIP